MEDVPCVLTIRTIPLPAAITPIHSSVEMQVLARTDVRPISSSAYCRYHYIRHPTADTPSRAQSSHRVSTRTMMHLLISLRVQYSA